MKHFLRWVSPLILGVIEFYFLRLATRPSREAEWWPDFNNQLRALLLDHITLLYQWITASGTSFINTYSEKKYP